MPRKIARATYKCRRLFVRTGSITGFESVIAYARSYWDFPDGSFRGVDFRQDSFNDADKYERND